ncbi:unnamed protein product [Candidula unifasciata]|uniref:BCL2-associated athanogene 6 n=1 Tax=Candidula unifasciata TaxID=100452 RepID=A0A8S4A435_9EUPU|nr:unnamed protein product [Candidula unifasciata]
MASSQGALIDITVKTLDGQNRTFSVPEKLNVRQFKEKISTNVEVPADNQRLIFQGRVMQDDKVLKDYDIHGKVIHLVQRAPPTTASASGNLTSTAASASASSPDRPHNPLDGNLLDVQIHLGRVQNTPTTREARARLRQADFNLRLVNDVLTQLEQRLGSLSDNSVTQALSGSQTPASTSAASTVPDGVTEDMQVSPVADGSSQRERDPAGSEAHNGAGSREQAGPSPAQSGSEPAGAVSGDALGLMAADLANFLDQVLSTNERVASHIRLYRDILRSEVAYPAMSRESQDVQEVASRATEVFHALGHMLHSLSDVVVDMGADMPRQAVATPSAPFPFPGISGMPGTTSMAIPIHMNVRARHNSNGRRQASSTASTTSTSTVPTASTGAATASFSGSSTPPPAGINIPLISNPTRRSFQMPPVPLTLPPNVTTTGEPHVMVDVLPAGITVHDIRVTAAGIEDDSDSSADSVDNNGISATITTITPSVNTENPLPATATTSSPAASASSTASLTASTQPATPATASTGTFTSSTGTNSHAFIFSPGGTINIREVPTFASGQMPNVPGLPAGMFQNIVGSILNTHGIGPDQQIQVNILPQTADIPTMHGVQLIQQRLNNRDEARTAAAQFGPEEQQAVVEQFLAGIGLPGGLNTVSHASSSNNTTSSTGNQSNTTTSSATAAPSTTPSSATSTTTPSTTSSATTVNFGGTSRSSFPTGFSWTNPVPLTFGTASDPSSNARATRNPPFSFHQFGSPSQARPQAGQPRAPASGPLRRSYVDPYLPCSSPHYSSQTALATFSAMQAQSRGQPVPEQIPNLSTMVSGMVGDIMEQVAAAANGENRTRTSSTTSVSTSSSSTPLRATAAAGLRPQYGTLNPMEMFTHLLGRQTGSAPANPQPQSTPLPSTASDPAANREPAAASAGWTLADLFTRVGRTSGDVTVIISLLEAVAPHMGLTDLFSLFMGNTRVLNQLREPLQVFVRRQVTHFGSVDQVVEAALADMYPEIQHLQSLVELKDGLDLAESLRSCLKVHLTIIFTAIHSDSAGAQGDFGNHMYRLWMKMMADSIGLCIYCMRDGQTGFSNMVQSYMPRMTQGMSPAITVWMTTSLQDIFQSFYQNHPVTDSDIVGYVVKSHPERSAVSTSEGLGQSSAVSDGRLSPDHGAVSVSTCTLSNDSSPSPMDTAEPLSSQGRVARLALDEDLDENDIFEDAQESIIGLAPLQNRPNTIAVQASRVGRAVERSGNLRNGRSSDDWQSVVPQDWIPVISRDIIRQQNQRTQPPLSDAYLQGLPAKRRRMASLEHADEMGNMPLYLPTSLKRAARAADAEPISSEENMAQEAADDLDLQTELESEVTRMLASRITSDQDFASDRFPNAKEYFQKSNHR